MLKPTNKVARFLLELSKYGACNSTSCKYGILTIVVVELMVAPYKLP